jgi:hypothetical protein
METEAARILKALEKREPEWREKVIDLYDQGASNREVMRELKLTPGAWKALESNILDSDFAEIIELGRLYAQAWWESQGRINLKTRGFNTSLWTANMNNRYGWSNKTDSTTTVLDLSNASDEDLLKSIKEKSEKLGLSRDR